MKKTIKKEKPKSANAYYPVNLCTNEDCPNRKKQLKTYLVDGKGLAFFCPDVRIKRNTKKFRVILCFDCYWEHVKRG